MNAERLSQKRNTQPRMVVALQRLVPAADGRSLVDLLSEDEPDEKFIHSRLKECAGELALRVAKRGPSMRELLASRGAVPEPTSDHEFRSTVEWYSRIGK